MSHEKPPEKPKTNAHNMRIAIIVGLIMFALPFILMGLSVLAESQEKSYPEITSIYWSDGDSGRINGSLKFRLANVDAPETGSMKQRGGAKCEAERALGYESKSYIVKLTKGAVLRIERDQGLDRYERLVIDLSADGVDVGTSGLSAGHFRAWPHKGRKALQVKPDWCD